MLICKNISKSFSLDNSANRVNVLYDINLAINSNQTIALQGPSGSGKSTLLNLIAGLDEPSSGEICLDGININKLSVNGLADFRNQNIGIIFQFFNLINDLTVLENISFTIAVERCKQKKIRQES